MRFYIEKIIKIFYLLDFMRAMLYKPTYMFLKSAEALRDDINEVYAKYTHNLANILYDYIIYAIVMELEHAPDKCDITPQEIAGYPTYKLYDYFTKRDMSSIYPKTFLKMALKVFESGDWEYAYGGWKWAKAVQYAINRPKMSDVLFIDSVVDLQHNTSSLFSKSNPFFHPCDRGIIGFLDNKTRIERENELFSYIYTHTADELNKELRLLGFRFLQVYSGREWSQEKIGDFYDSFDEHSIIYLNSRAWTGNISMLNSFFSYTPIKYSSELVEYSICSSSALNSIRYGYSVDGSNEEETKVG